VNAQHAAGENRDRNRREDLPWSPRGRGWGGARRRGRRPSAWRPEIWAGCVLSLLFSSPRRAGASEWNAGGVASVCSIWRRVGSGGRDEKCINGTGRNGGRRCRGEGERNGSARMSWIER
jgi:hypothetical protein